MCSLLPTEHIAAFAIVYGTFLSLGSSEQETAPVSWLKRADLPPSVDRTTVFPLLSERSERLSEPGPSLLSPRSLVVRTLSVGTLDRSGPGSGLVVVPDIVTVFVEPLTNDGIAGEDAEFRVYLEAHGYDAGKTGNRLEASAFVLFKMFPSLWVKPPDHECSPLHQKRGFLHGFYVLREIRAPAPHSRRRCVLICSDFSVHFLTTHPASLFWFWLDPRFIPALVIL